MPSSPNHLASILECFWIQPSLYAVAKLGIAGLLSKGPRTITDLAATTNTHPASLHRLLKALSSKGIFIEVETGVFAQTPMSNALNDSLSPVRSWALLIGEHWYRQTWGALLHSVTTGETAFNHVHKKALFDFLEEHTEAAILFHDDMYCDAQCQGNLLDVYDFSTFRSIYDIGGGYGALMISVLSKNQHLTGVLFDTAKVTPEAKRRLDSAGLAARCRLLAGNFFECVPKGGDLYVLKNILHDWNDENATLILKNCRSAMSNNGKIVILEQVLDSANVNSPVHYVNLAMLVLTGGRERTSEEYCSLVSSASLRLSRIIPTHSSFSIIEGEAA